LEKIGEGKEKLIRGIEKDANEEVKRIIADAKRVANERISASTKQAKSIIANAQKKAVEQSELLKKKILSGINMEVKRKSMKIRDKVLNDLIDQAKIRLNKMIYKPEYLNILIDWIVEAGIGLGKEKAFVNASKEEIQMLDENLLHQAEDKIMKATGKIIELKKSEEHPLKSQGVVVISDDGKVAFNNMVSTRILRRQTEIRNIVYKSLFDI